MAKRLINTYTGIYNFAVFFAVKVSSISRVALLTRRPLARSSSFRTAQSSKEESPNPNESIETDFSHSSLISRYCNDSMYKADGGFG